jgi:hypothetical protein
MFWDVTRWHLVEMYRRFGEVNCLHHRKESQNKQRTDSETSVNFYHTTRRHISENCKKQSYSCNMPCRPIGLWDIETPTFSRQSAHLWRWGCQPYAPNYPCNRPCRPIGLWEVEAPAFSRNSAHRLRWGCRPYVPAGRPLPPRNIPGTHFC